MAEFVCNWVENNSGKAENGSNISIVQRETTLTISDSTETGSTVESKIKREREREREREGGREGETGREGGREREGGMEGGRERGREAGREREREKGRERERESLVRKGINNGSYRVQSSFSKTQPSRAPQLSR